MEDSSEKMLTDHDDDAKFSRKCPCSSKKPPKIGDLARKPTLSTPNPERRIHAGKDSIRQAARAVGGKMASPLQFKLECSPAGHWEGSVNNF